MFLQTLELTTALRPELLPDETLLFVQDAVGLYEGYDRHDPVSPFLAVLFSPWYEFNNP